MPYGENLENSKLIEKEFSPLLFGDPAPFGGRQGSRLSRVGVATHSFLIPAVEQAHIDVELIKDTGDGLIDDIIQSLRTMIEGGNRRKNHCAHARERNHCFQMAQVKRR